MELSPSNINQIDLVAGALHSGDWHGMCVDKDWIGLGLLHSLGRQPLFDPFIVLVLLVGGILDSLCLVL